VEVCGVGIVHKWYICCFNNSSPFAISSPVYVWKRLHVINNLAIAKQRSANSCLIETGGQSILFVEKEKFTHQCVPWCRSSGGCAYYGNVAAVKKNNTFTLVPNSVKAESLVSHFTRLRKYFPSGRPLNKISRLLEISSREDKTETWVTKLGAPPSITTSFHPHKLVCNSRVRTTKRFKIII
jgi:hypothetical protein